MTHKKHSDKADPTQRMLGMDRVESDYSEADEPARRPFSKDTDLSGEIVPEHDIRLKMASRPWVTSTSPLGHMLNPANMIPPLPIPVQLPDFSTPDPFQKARDEQRVYDRIQRPPITWMHFGLIAVLLGLVATLLLWLNVPPAAGTTAYYEQVLDGAAAETTAQH
jgi:hypothetical protein